LKSFAGPDALRLENFEPNGDYVRFVGQNGADLTAWATTDSRFAPKPDKITILRVTDSQDPRHGKLDQKLVPYSPADASLCQTLEVTVHIGSEVPAGLYSLDVKLGRVHAYSDELSQDNRGNNGAHRMKEALNIIIIGWLDGTGTVQGFMPLVREEEESSGAGVACARAASAGEPPQPAGEEFELVVEDTQAPAEQRYVIALLGKDIDPRDPKNRKALKACLQDQKTPKSLNRVVDNNRVMQGSEVARFRFVDLAEHNAAVVSPNQKRQRGIEDSQNPNRVFAEPGDWLVVAQAGSDGGLKLDGDGNPMIGGLAMVFKVAVLKPIDANGDGIVNDLVTSSTSGNVFLFGGDVLVNAASARATMECLIGIVPDTKEFRQMFKEKLRTETEPFTPSNNLPQLTWDSRAGGDPTVGQPIWRAHFPSSPTSTGEWRAVATFTGLPAVPELSYGRVPANVSSLLFGTRWLTVTLLKPQGADPYCVRKAPFEVCLGSNMRIERNTNRKSTHFRYCNDKVAVAGPMVETVANYQVFLKYLLMAEGERSDGFDYDEVLPDKVDKAKIEKIRGMETPMRREIYEKMNCSTETFRFWTREDASENVNMRLHAINAMGRVASIGPIGRYAVDACPDEPQTANGDYSGIVVHFFNGEPAAGDTSWTGGRWWDGAWWRPTFRAHRPPQPYFTSVKGPPSEALAEAYTFLGECLGASDLCLLEAAWRSVGVRRFDTMHRNLVIGLSILRPSTGGSADLHRRLSSDKKTYVPGDSMYYMNDPGYKGDIGPWTGEHCLYVGRRAPPLGDSIGRFTGLGAGYQTEQELRDLMVGEAQAQGIKNPIPEGFRDDKKFRLVPPLR
jgi:hypothetical protein